jgi:CRP/FNR family transcriptional regulator, dissimilatory nitrate respiration regulator
MKKIVEIIAQTPLFGGLPEDQLKAVCAIAVTRRFAKGEIVFTEGQPGSGFYVVMNGRVKIFKVSAEGKEQILHIFGPGEPFGEVPVFSGKPFPASAEAIEKSRLLFFPKQAFVDLTSAMPSLALNMLAVLSMRLRQFTVQIENLSLKEVPGRLASYLVYLAAEQAAADSVTLTISKGQLASLLGTIPETLSRMMAKMAGMGLIQVEGRTIRLLNRDALEDLAKTGKLMGIEG